MIKTENLDNQERDLDLVNRDPRGASKVRADIERMKPAADDELKALRQRIATALATTPQDPRAHCADCFSRGWAAALKSLET